MSSGGSPATQRRDAGYSVLEVAITLPVVLMLIMLVLQAGTVWYGRSIAQATAREGLRAAAAYNATDADGKSRAADYLHQVAPHALTHPNVTVTRSLGTQTITVQVAATVPALVPFTTFTVHSSASGPVEKYRTAP